MANLANYKEFRGWTGHRETIEVVYDFSKDGGTVGVLNAFKALEAMVVHSVVAKVNTTCTSSGLATVSLGVNGDAAGLVAATAVASLTAGAAIDSASFGSSYKLAKDAVVQVAIAVEALTAGKITFQLEVSKF